MDFEWHKAKNTINKQKHGVSFEEAKTVFYDPDALVIGDLNHSDTENRFVILGLSAHLRILVVCHCYRKKSNIRIISARKANTKEIKQYNNKKGEKYEK